MGIFFHQRGFVALVAGSRGRAPEVELAPSQVRPGCVQAVRVEPRSADSSPIETGNGKGRVMASPIPAGIARFKRVQNYFLGFGPEGCLGGRVQNPPSLRRGVLNPPPEPSGVLEPGEGSECGGVNPNFEPSGWRAWVRAS